MAKNSNLYEERLLDERSAEIHQKAETVFKEATKVNRRVRRKLSKVAALYEERLKG